MTKAANLLPLFPLLISLVGACGVGLWPERILPKRGREGMYVGWLFLTAFSLWATTARHEIAAPVPSPLSFLSEGLIIQWDAPARWGAAFLLGVNALMNAIPLLMGQILSRGRLEMAALLVLYGASLAALSAGNLPMLCLAWAVGEMATASIHAVRAFGEERRRTLWNAWGGLAALFLLISAAASLTASQGRTTWANVPASPWALRILLFSALLKMAIPSLSGRLLERAETYFPSLVMGAFLWGRLFTLSPQPLAPQGPWAALGAITLGGTGLLAALTPDFSVAFAYIVLNRLVMALLAPFLAPMEGPAIAWVAILNIILIAALWRASVASLQGGSSWGQVARVWALLALLGVPLTPGFLAHWAFLRQAWLGGLPPVLFWGSFSLLLTAVPIWRCLTAPIEASAAPVDRKRWPRWAAVGGIAILIAGDLALGIAPRLALGVWGGMRLTPVWEGSSELLGTLTYLALLGPFLGGYGLGRILEGLPDLWGRALRVLRGLLLLDWLIYLIEEVLIRLQTLADDILAAIERRFYLAWTLVWGIAIILLYVERRR